HGPFGAVVARDGVVLGEGWNRVVADRDPTAHAEIMAIRAAADRAGTHVLEGCTIYCSCEPCP
ncbi:MAG: nucleoside deaminase, partial [Gemmatimonadetes bacterium]|nr:nucleoside deaminase [Gemmatimonadota bacterium]NIQ53187.1 nucleoside deaminase [Gemmatimonadota bacterium]NIU73335.1 nucleoside deaminase [Gammaproteobacteria bacterium]NIX43571.1 nucleoside deaminase [Gemmatimonadota bacterium]